MAEDRKALGNRINEEVWNQGNVDAYAELVAPNIVRHAPPMPDVVGLEALKAYVHDIRGAYSEFTLKIRESILDGDMSAGRFTIEGVHTGASPSIPVPPTGKRIRAEGAIVSRWEDGKIVEEWVYNDYLGLMQQLGVIPRPG